MGAWGDGGLEGSNSSPSPLPHQCNAIVCMSGLERIQKWVWESFLMTS